MNTKTKTFQDVFFVNDTATTEIYTLSLHDALPIWSLEIAVTASSSERASAPRSGSGVRVTRTSVPSGEPPDGEVLRSEEHTSELQSRQYLVCRLLLEKKTLS